jgi:hypothetical protein
MCTTGQDRGRWCVVRPEAWTHVTMLME